MKHLKILLAAYIALIAAGGIFAAETSEMLPVERYALYVASNDGGTGRERLRYARTDAKRLSETMAEIGGIDSKNSMMLVDPSFAEVNKAFASITDSIRKNAGRARRTEFLFYYSGHSDETSLLLGNETYDYGSLKSALSKIPSDVHVVMLDSCYSGNFVRAKGGSRQKPFLMDDSTIVQGHAYLSSSSEHEESQESDAIQASYFTQALVTGLRGAADASGDSKVSLNELYHFAFNETLSKTESSSVGPQHPSYNITLVGSGDLVLTDISEAESILHIPAHFEGNFFIRNPDGLLVSEINKIGGTEVALALPSGSYTIAIVTPATMSQGMVYLAKGQRLSLEGRNFSVMSRSSTRSRGNASVANGANETYTAVALSFCPGISIPSPMTDNVNLSLGIFMADNKNVEGMQASTFMGTVSGQLQGMQAAGFMNTSTGSFRGVQAAGFMNTSSSEDLFYGAQLSGFLNSVNGDLYGMQNAGFLNETRGDVMGAQFAGFLNETKGNLKGAQFAGFMNNAKGTVYGYQGSGFLNNISGDMTGAQMAGFLNIVHGTSTGVQASGFLNIADTINGAQIGIVNIAHENTGIALGILNFIVEGIMSPSVCFDTNENLLVQYQGGTNAFFTTFLFGSDLDSNSEWLTDYTIFGFGCGTRVNVLPQVSFDLEILWKQVFDIAALIDISDRYGDNIEVDTEDGVETDAEKDMREWGENHMHCQIPSLRVTANWMMFRHLGAFAALNLDMMVEDFNEKAFTYGSYGSPMALGINGVKLYPSWSFGIRF